MKRSRIGGDVQHVVFIEVIDNRLHQGGPFAFACALDHVVELASEIAGRATGDSGNGAKTEQIAAMADGTGLGFAGSGFDEALTFFDAAARDVGDETGSGIAQLFGAVSIFGRFYDAMADGLTLGAFEGKIHADGEACFGNRIGFDNSDPWGPAHGRVVGGGGFDLLAGHRFGVGDHQIRVFLASVGTMAEAVAEVFHLVDEVRDGKASDAGVFGTPFSIRIVAEATSPNACRLAAH